jgi:hypothetical protein
VPRRQALAHKIASEPAGILNKHDPDAITLDAIGQGREPGRLSIGSAPLTTDR